MSNNSIQQNQNLFNQRFGDDLVADAQQNSGSGKSKGSKGSGSSGVGGSDSSIETVNNANINSNVMAMYLSGCMDFYDANAIGLSNTTELLDKSSEQSKEVSSALTALSLAQANAGTGNVSVSIGASSAYADGSTAYITSEQAALINNNEDDSSGNTGIQTSSYSNSSMSTLTSAISDLSSSLSSSNQEQLLTALMYSTNLQTAGSMATSGLSSIGQTMQTTGGNM